MSELPPLHELLESVRESNGPFDSLLHNSITGLLKVVLEAVPVLPALVSGLTDSIKESKQPDLPTTYGELIDQSLDIVRGWDKGKQALFIGGHPRIGEVKNLSAMSAAEQGQTTTTPVPTPPEVLQRLGFLNTVYERRYPGLVYITFVNGRSREQIKDEMEEKLVSEGVLSTAEQPGGLERITPWPETSDEWLNELDRAVGDVGEIAKSRLKKLGVE